MTNSSLVGIAGMGDRLRQLALIGLWHVSDASLMAALAQLPLLQVRRDGTDLSAGVSCQSMAVRIEQQRCLWNWRSGGLRDAAGACDLCMMQAASSWDVSAEHHKSV
jgi:hypothetical protein